jgi:hypothetical protein
MARDTTNYRIKDVARSDVLAFLAGMEKIHPDFCYPTTLPFRNITLSSAAPSVFDEEQVPSNFDFYCDEVMASINPVAADAIDIARVSYVNFRGEGLNRDVFSTQVSLSRFGFTTGVNGAAANVPQMSISIGNSLHFKVPYVFEAGQLIRANFTCDAALGGTAHIIEAWLSGYMVRTELLVLPEVETTKIDFSDRAIKVLDTILKALRG